MTYKNGIKIRPPGGKFERTPMEHIFKIVRLISVVGGSLKVSLSQEQRETFALVLPKRASLVRNVALILTSLFPEIYVWESGFLKEIQQSTLTKVELIRKLAEVEGTEIEPHIILW